LRRPFEANCAKFAPVSVLSKQKTIDFEKNVNIASNTFQHYFQLATCHNHSHNNHIHKTRFIYTMVSIRQANVDDLIEMQNTNLWCLPENYQVSSNEEFDVRVCPFL